MNAYQLILLGLCSIGCQAEECHDLAARSSWIGVVCYNNGSMSIEMQGAEYNFCDVPYDIFGKLVNADSPGTCYHEYVRGRYRCAGY